jgi:hypothetical protein
MLDDRVMLANGATEQSTTNQTIRLSDIGNPPQPSTAEKYLGGFGLQ